MRLVSAGVDLGAALPVRPPAKYRDRYARVAATAELRYVNQVADRVLAGEEGIRVMLAIGGIVCVIFCVFGGYIIFGGKIGIIIEAMPKEVMIIGGAASGAFMIANSGHSAKHAMTDVKRIFSGGKFHKEHYLQLITLLYSMTKLMKQKGSIAVEAHIENPMESTLFQKCPLIQQDKFVLALICDYMRMITLGLTSPHEIEAIIEKELNKWKEEQMHSSHAWAAVAGGTPALGIVAAVLGVIKTMASITEPPEVLGQLIGGALVGTFLGVFLSYGFMEPIANRLKSIVEEDLRFYETFLAIMVAHLNGYAPAVSAETGRKSVPNEYMPTFNELEEALNQA